MEHLILEEYMELNREISKDELNLLDFLVRKSGVLFDSDWKNNLKVCPMNDGGMGSLKLIPDGAKLNRKFGKQIAELQYKDKDGIDVLVSLNIDSEGKLFELDFWKMNYEKLLTLPNIE